MFLRFAKQRPGNSPYRAQTVRAALLRFTLKHEETSLNIRLEKSSSPA